MNFPGLVSNGLFCKSGSLEFVCNRTDTINMMTAVLGREHGHPFRLGAYVSTLEASVRVRIWMECNKFNWK